MTVSDPVPGEGLKVSPRPSAVYSNKSFKANRTLWGKVKYVLSHMTVEPIVFFYVIPGTMGLMATQNMNLEKACRVNIGFNSTICDAMVARDHSKYEDYQEEEVQELVSKMLIVKTIIVGFFPTCLLLFFGSWSDRNSRRKPLILIPIIGDVLSYISLLVCALFFYELTLEYSVLSDSLPFSLTGGPPCMALGLYSYVSGISSDKDRTLRVGAVSLFQNVAVAVGNAIAGPLIGPLGFKGVYLLSTGIMITLFFYGWYFLQDNSVGTKRNDRRNCCVDFFDLSHVRKTFELCFKEGPRNRKWKMIVMLIVTFMIMGPFYGENAVLYLYTRITFGWNEVDFSIFSTLQFIIQTSGSIFALSYFTKYLKLSDATLGVIAMLSKIAACLIFALAPSGRYFLIGVFVEVFNGTSHIAMRSLITKLVPPHELGQSSSVFGICEAVVPLIFGPFYSTLYNRTIRTFPGTFYLVSVGFYLLTCCMFCWIHRTTQRDLRREQLMKNLYNERKLSEQTNRRIVNVE